LKIIKGKTKYLHGFGQKIGHCEIDSTECKSIKGEIYILNQGIHILQIVSACVMKSPIL
jgi:hypothetical protein